MRRDNDALYLLRYNRRQYGMATLAAIIVLVLLLGLSAPFSKGKLCLARARRLPRAI